MDSSKLSIKFYLRDPAALHAHDIVPVFHRWIQTHAIPGHHLIDVADYKHVPDGPGTVLVSHEANLYSDATDGRLGLMYVRKSPIEGDLPTRLREVFRSALGICKMFEEEPTLAGRGAFRTEEILFRINDRLHAPHTVETSTAVKPAVEAFLTKLYGGPVELAFTANEETLFEIGVKATGAATIGELFNRLS